MAAPHPQEPTGSDELPDTAAPAHGSGPDELHELPAPAHGSGPDELHELPARAHSAGPDELHELHELPEPDAALPDARLAAVLVRAAGMLALQLRGEGLTGERKTSVSDVVTAADYAAERYIVAQLRRSRPNDGIHGEEGASHTGSSGRIWVIDPVDGTYNFLSGFTYWCSALALKNVVKEQDVADAEHHGGELGADPLVLLGAIYQPQEDKLWLGGENLPASLNGRPLAGPADLPLAQISAGTYLHPTWLAQSRAAEPWLSATTRTATVRMLGSGSCDLARVADGTLGCWFQHSCPEWDWLPGKAIVRAAGGSTAVVRVNELDWFIAGAATAVNEVAAALRHGAEDCASAK